MFEVNSLGNLIIVAITICLVTLPIVDYVAEKFVNKLLGE